MSFQHNIPKAVPLIQTVFSDCIYLTANHAAVMTDRESQPEIKSILAWDKWKQMAALWVYREMWCADIPYQVQKTQIMGSILHTAWCQCAGDGGRNGILQPRSQTPVWTQTQTQDMMYVAGQGVHTHLQSAAVLFCTSLMDGLSSIRETFWTCSSILPSFKHTKWT